MVHDTSSLQFSQTGHVATIVLDRQQALNAIDPGAFLQSPGLWLGLAAAAVLLFVAIRIRRYRDDT